jgi:F-type H+-transporting ATPase subunit b
MLIDWFTVGAQTLNFLILAWLMKRFLYQPILNAIDQREQRIAAELAAADNKKAEAQQIHDEFQQKNLLFDQQRAELLRKATDEALTERTRMLDSARQAADILHNQRMATLENDAHNLNLSISRRIQQEVFAITRKALLDLADTGLEERMAAVFTRRLAQMDAETHQGFAEALKTAIEPAIMRCAFALPMEQQAILKNALNESFAAEIKVRFETAPDLIGGIELSANGWKLAWSLADYLDSLESQVSESISSQAKPETGNAKSENGVKASLAEAGK